MMVIVDTSVWIDHLRTANGSLAELLEDDLVLVHPFVVGELACGTMKQRGEFLALLGFLPSAPLVSFEEMMVFLEARKLYGKGLGWVDVHLLGSALLCKGKIWSQDKSLQKAAASLHLAYEP